MRRTLPTQWNECSRRSTMLIEAVAVTNALPISALKGLLPCVQMRRRHSRMLVCFLDRPRLSYASLKLSRAFSPLILVALWVLSSASTRSHEIIACNCSSPIIRSAFDLHPLPVELAGRGIQELDSFRTKENSEPSETSRFLAGPVAGVPELFVYGSFLVEGRTAHISTHLAEQANLYIRAP